MLYFKAMCLQCCTCIPHMMPMNRSCSDAQCMKPLSISKHFECAMAVREMDFFWHGSLHSFYWHGSLQQCCTPVEGHVSEGALQGLGRCVGAHAGHSWHIVAVATAMPKALSLRISYAYEAYT